MIAELGARGFGARPADTHDGWDITATRGLFVSCRITTAILWRWTPVFRVRVRVRRVVPALVVVSGVIAAVVTPFALAALAVGDTPASAPLPADSVATPGMVYVATLRNGFSMRFDHRELIEEAQSR